MKTLSKVITLSAILLALPVLADSTTDALQQAADHHVRSEQNKNRDQYRHPVQTLAFFEVTPNSTVVEISPGGGWYTEILAPLLAAHGKYYAAHFPADSSSDYYKRNLAAFKEKLAANPIYSRVELTAFAPGNSGDIAPAGSADVVLTFRNLHNWYGQGGDEAMVTIFKDFYTALKPGGVLGVVEHRLPADQADGDWTKSGYFPQQLAITLAEQAGFVLEQSSEINANPKDTAEHPRGVWTLPPVMRLGEEDKAKYQAIGESDRMTLKFRKPVAQ
ncbi:MULTISPECIES: class I SAM-dependent methyltransferase [unclassified Arsukibacterium]|uniref:class I SAM-dependent methyltransferase n=1 Tax=unclassified Arsukibacterium TaxID=2635278 RepID=UPI000C57077B|nr:MULTISPECIES: methyltransferase [unclassified Arsukibacterium]MAA96024.1 methyltransferase [Rheinheimera sp.]MBM34319.1 methyltransferase [Rheinheimera sp.]HAW92294.1 methyltransferase [Candidatus Azambacteria bacterium]|tara:strand:- start:33030 stop:33854 length:825 start_codon:yes stop_codon:yes gene_type:complete